jgi:hypothetical protein
MMGAMNVFQGIGVEVVLVAVRFAIPALVIYGICRANKGICRWLNIPEDEPQAVKPK